jgi:hypothetical protein
MKLYIKQGCAVSLDEPDNVEAEGWSPVDLPADCSPIIVTLCEDITLVKYHNKTDALLIVFPHFKGARKGKALVVKLHDMPVTTRSRELSHIVFAKLLGFDTDQLSNRSRNAAIMVVRSMLPDVVRGHIGGDVNGLAFYLSRNSLSLYKDKKQIIKLSHYTLLSRNIKDLLL